MIGQDIKYTINLAHGIPVITLNTPLAQGDDRAQKFIFELMNGDDKADTSALACTAYFVRGEGQEDSDTIPLGGEFSDNILTVELKSGCYTKQTYFVLSVRLIDQNTGIKRTIVFVRGVVRTTQDGGSGDPDESLPSVEEILALMDDVEKAIERANEAAERAENAAGSGGGGGGLPTGGGAYQQLVTDGDGNAMWEDRTHYSVMEEVTVLPDGDYEIDPSMNAIMFMTPFTPTLVVGGEYRVTIDGEVFAATGTAASADGMDIVYIGNPSFISVGESNGLPFVMMVLADAGMAESVGFYGMMAVVGGDDTTVHLKVTGTAETTVKIPAKYIPDPKNGYLVNGSAMGSLRTVFSAEENDEYTIGQHAFAEGRYTKASGDSSHAEGYETVASGISSHAEGDGTVASAKNSHAEGSGTVASGISSHAEGCNTVASGWSAHAEGDNTVAGGRDTHAEGYETVAASSYQHVQGKWNIEDKDGKYAHIVGNGNTSKRSNAHTLDWNGNAWYQGRVLVGGTSQSDADYLVTRTELESAVGSGNVIPSYWLTHLNERIPAIRAAMTSAGWKKSAFLWYHDVHWTYGYKRAPMLLKYLYEHTPINKTMFGGDVVDNEGDTSTMTYLWDWRDAVRGLPNHHSVPGNHDDGNTTDNLWDDPYIYAYLLAAEETPDVVRTDAGLYYYIDDPTEKTRYLYIDTATKDGNIINDTAEQAWLKESLKSTPAGWHIVAIAHIWRTVDYDASPPADAGWSYGGAYCIGEFDKYNARTGEYASCTGKVEFCIGGHTHVDADFVSDGGIPVILTECDSRYVRSGLECTEGTITESSVNAIVADYANGIVNVIRIGRGSSRTVNLDGSGSSGGEPPDVPDVPTGDFTNTLTEAGFSEGMRFSTSSLTDVEAAGWDITGYIPATRGDVIRFANVNFLDLDGTGGTSRAMIYLFDANKTYITCSANYDPNNLMSDAWSAVYGDDGDLIQFTIPTSYSSTVAYIRIGARNIDQYSVITVNEPIE